ncbi:MAG: VanW family protein [Veillonellales bacterium]
MKIATVKSPNHLFMFLGIIILFSSVSVLAVNSAFLFTDEIYRGVSIGDISVGGLSVEQAEQKIAAAFTERTKAPPIVLEYQEQAWTVTAQNIELTLDAADLAQQAYQVGRKGSFFNQIQERYVAINHGITIPLMIHYNQETLLTIIKDIAQSINREPHNAVLVQRGTTIHVIPEVIGLKIDVDTAAAEIAENLNHHFPFKLALVVQEEQPSVVASDFADIDGLIALYTTQFNSSNKNRTQNIRLAAKSINNILVHSDEVVSFNNLVGLRLEKFGYQEAPVFIDGKLVPDWGGGVCQVSSTLYNAVLLADLGIVERTSHYSPPGYVPLGQDATVADNLLDFKFKNTTSHNIYISSEVSGNQLIVYIFGKERSNSSDIRIEATDKKILEPNTIIKQDPNLELGKEVVEVEGQKGFQITTYRVKYVNGAEISRDYLATDEFKPEDRVVRVGTKNDSNQLTK